MKNNNEVFKSFAMVIQLGLSMLAPVILSTLLGVYLENRFSIPVAVPFVILGILAGCRNTWILVKSIIQDPKKKEDKKDDGDSRDE